MATHPRVSAGIVASFAVFSSAGAGDFQAAIFSQASASVAVAGVGDFQPAMVGQASAVMNSAGVAGQTFTLQGNASAVFSAGGLGDFQAPSIVTAFMALSASGAGDVVGAAISISSASLSAVGTGAFAAAMTAQVSAVATFEGNGYIQAVDTPASEAMFGGVGAFAAVSYAFYADADMLAPHDEPRVLYAPWEDRNPVTIEIIAPEEPRETYAVAENRIAVVPYEGRVYDVSSKAREQSPPNRRRKP